MRNKRLDILRFVAIVLVMFHHRAMGTIFTRAGWIGVDLFFVLSGFLISGLLFAEYKKRKTIDFKRFFVRRGFKIYPSFWLFLAATAWYHPGKAHLATKTWFQVLFFVQNYFPQREIWRHTWSLAVEEHFYIFLPLMLLVMLRLFHRSRDPFRYLPLSFLVVVTFCTATRAILAYSPTFDPIGNWGVTGGTSLPNFATHARMDALFFGVLLGYFYHFYPAQLERLLRPSAVRAALAIVSIALVIPSVLWSRENRVMLVFGVLGIYLGFGGILLVSLIVNPRLPGPVGRIARWTTGVMAFFGMYSYSIYLWHVPINILVRNRVLHTHLDGHILEVIYLVLSLAFGVLASKMVEYPALHLRDRLFPPRTSAPTLSAIAKPAAADAIPATAGAPS